MSEIVSNAPAQGTALGFLIIILSGAVVFLWRQLAIERAQSKKELADERKSKDEDQRQYHKELIELTDRLVSSQAELQSLLKSLTDVSKIENLFEKYSKKD